MYLLQSRLYYISTYIVYNVLIITNSLIKHIPTIKKMYKRLLPQREMPRASQGKAQLQSQ